MYKYLLIFIAVLVFLFTEKTKGQIASQMQVPKYLLSAITDEITTFNLPPLHPYLRKKADSQDGIENRIGTCEKVNFDIKKLAFQTNIPEKGTLYQFKFASDSAYALSLTFSKFYIPENAFFYIQSSTGELISSIFDSKNNNADSCLTTMEYDTNCLIFSYFEPLNTPNTGQLVISSINQMYKNYKKNVATTNHSINCTLGNDYQDIKHAVCKITYIDGTSAYSCTASLINNTANNAVPYLLTAAHCVNTEALAKTVVAYFDNEYVDCSASLIKEKTMSVASLMETLPETDFTLLKLSQNVPESYSPCFAGWDVSGTNYSQVVCIHHAQGNPKNIDISPYSILDFPEIIYWDKGNPSAAFTNWAVRYLTDNSIAGGSSGSALLNPLKQIIGQLHGGDDTLEYYGKLDLSYQKSSKFRTLIDPLNLGVKTLPPYSPASTTPAPAIYTRTHTVCANEEVEIQNASLFNPTKCEWSITPASFHYVEGYTKNSPIVKVVFENSGKYSITLTVSNSYGSASHTFQNYITVAETLDISSVSLPDDSVLCAGQINDYPLYFKGAQGYTFAVTQTYDYLNITQSDTSVILTKKAEYPSASDYSLQIKVKGTQGNCSKEINRSLQILPAKNDKMSGPLEIGLGKSGPYCNKCASYDSNEPTAIIGFCTAQKYWCSESQYSSRTIQNSLWYKYKAVKSGNLIITSTGMDNQIAVYAATSNDQTMYEASDKLIAANDDQTAANTNPKITECPVTEGNIYWIQVDGSKGGQIGTFYLDLTQDLAFVSINPSKEKLSITLNTIDRTNVNLEVFDITGKLVYETLLNNETSLTNVEIPINGISSGIYVVKLYTNKENWSQKIILMK